MQDERPQKCNTTFPNGKGRPAPADILTEELDINCCKSFCLVDPSCSSAVSWKGFEPLMYSFDVCQDSPDVMDMCPWKQQGSQQEIRTIVRDHVQQEVEPKVLDFEASASPKSGSIAQGETFSYMLKMAGATPEKPFIATLTWTDPPGQVGAADVLVNDLDLIVSVRTYTGNSSWIKWWGNNKENGDPYNNVEQVRIESAERAEVNISVFARRVVASITSYNEPAKEFLDAQAKLADRITKDKLADYLALNASNSTGAADSSTGTTTMSTQPRKTAPVGGAFCQPFALVMTGNIETGVAAALKVNILPNPYTLGICGRPQPPKPPPPPLLTPEQIALIIGCSVAGFFVSLAITYR
jgi:hypothetical protein